MRWISIYGILLLYNTAIFPNPTDGTVVSGEASICYPRSDTCLIEAKDRAILEWGSFSILENETARFIMPSSNCSLLNRVVGNDPSSLLGALESNGAVYLINQNGIVFGENCIIDAGSFIASTLDLKDAAFIAGQDLLFEGESHEAIVNLGMVQANTGPVVLLAHLVENKGSISAPLGTAAIGSGHRILLQPEGSRLLYIDRGGGEGLALEGALAALKTELQAGVHPYALGIQMNGSVDAMHVEKRGQEIYLKISDGPLAIAKSAHLEANEVTIDVHNSNVANRGKISAKEGSVWIDSSSDGNLPPFLNGGEILAKKIISIHAPKFFNEGELRAEQISIEAASAYIDSQRSRINARDGAVFKTGSSFFSSGSITSEEGSVEISSGLVRLVGNAISSKEKIAVFAEKPIGINSFSSLDGSSVEFHVKEEKKEFRGNFTLNALPLLGEDGGQTCVCPIFEFVDPHPSGVASLFMGYDTKVNALPNGNVVISKPTDNFGAMESGSVFLYNGANQALISFLYGETAMDHVGSGVKILTNGNYAVQSPEWRNTVAMVNMAGAATWRDAAGSPTEAVSTSNSIYGTHFNDRVSVSSIYPLTNGNAVIASGAWNGGLGAATLMNGLNGTDANGVFAAVSTSNSITGAAADGVAGQGVEVLKNGNGVILTISWGTSRGAATWINGTTGQDGNMMFGTVGVGNSIVGNNPGDLFGATNAAFEDPVGGHCMIGSFAWQGFAGTDMFTGIATWMNGTNGQSATGYGPINPLNSIFGTFPFQFAGNIWPLANGHGLITSVNWGAMMGTMEGAVTWVDGTTGQSVTGFGPITAMNSITGMAGDQIGTGGVASLPTGNAIIGSPQWNGTRGAVTWVPGDGTGMGGTVTAANSVTGANAGDLIGNSIYLLTNGNVIAGNGAWDGGRGAATWINGVNGTDAFGVYGTVSAANSIVGTLPTDNVGVAIPLENGNAVLVSTTWDDYRGAATWINGENGQDALGQYSSVSESNSLVGTVGGGFPAGDQVGTEVVPLPNGGFVVYNLYWNTNTGALTLGNGEDGTFCGGFGEVNAQNSLMGPQTNSNLQTAYNQLVVDETNQNFLFIFNDYSGQTRVFCSSYLGCYIPPSISAFGTHEYLIAISEAFARCLYNSYGGYLEEDDFPPANTNKEMGIPIPSLVSFEKPDLPKAAPDLQPPWNTNL